ncbi:hypothetical protein [Caldimonas thermodepolymerans]|jgi:hypothetical protein|uniref:hypothetical protein n=1 Tax=Caldimonas thermodepolymerans TaxID=215580 RepID=UPI0024928F1C|nr:hypothetical protein [Caldimonas thermodepolymerans]
MRTWSEALRAAWTSGGWASLASTCVLAWRGRADNGRIWGALNAPGHWVWGDAALREDGPSLRHTGTGLAVHHLASLFWGLLYERACPAPRPRAVRRLCGHAAAVASVAAAVDLRLAPPRLTPGFEHRLSTHSLVAVYAAFAVGIVLGGWWVDRRHGACRKPACARGNALPPHRPPRSTT